MAVLISNKHRERILRANGYQADHSNMAVASIDKHGISKIVQNDTTMSFIPYDKVGKENRNFKNTNSADNAGTFSVSYKKLSYSHLKEAMEDNFNLYLTMGAKGIKIDNRGRTVKQLQDEQLEAIRNITEKDGWFAVHDTETLGATSHNNFKMAPKVTEFSLTYLRADIA